MAIKFTGPKNIIGIILFFFFLLLSIWQLWSMIQTSKDLRDNDLSAAKKHYKIVYTLTLLFLGIGIISLLCTSLSLTSSGHLIIGTGTIIQYKKNENIVYKSNNPKKEINETDKLDENLILDKRKNNIKKEEEQEEEENNELYNDTSTLNQNTSDLSSSSYSNVPMDLDLVAIFNNPSIFSEN